MKLEEIARKFNVNGELVEECQITNGHINLTYKLTFKENDINTSYILQRMNKYVFKNPPELMENIVNTTTFIRNNLKDKNVDIDRMVLNFKKTFDNKNYFIDENEEYWRLYYFVKDSISYNDNLSLDILNKGAKAFGEFMNELSTYDASTLHITIKDFHNTIARFDQLKEAVKLNKANRLNEVKDVLDDYMKFEELACKMTNMLNNNELPLRVTHNDTKCNNVLFDEKTNDSLAIIDLDTIMPGLLGFDFGDALRTAGSDAKEDEKDLTMVKFNLDKFYAFASGYVPTVKESITKNELETLALGCFTMTAECGTRFLADYLNGDVYFHTNYSEHNLVRSKNQLALAKDIYNKLDKMNEIVQKIYNE